MKCLIISGISDKRIIFCKTELYYSVLNKIIFRSNIIKIENKVSKVIKKSFFILYIFFLFLIFYSFSAIFMTGCGNNTSNNAAPTEFGQPTVPARPTESAFKFAHGPRIGLVTADSVTIYWDTDTAIIGVIRWGTNKDYMNILAGANPEKNHRITLTHLLPGTKYYYKVEDLMGAIVSQEHTFSTPVLPDTDFTFASMGDSRGDSVQQDIYDLPEAFHKILNLVNSRNPAFLIHVGDIFCGGSDTNLENLRKLYSTFKKVTDPIAANIPFLISPGNHEMCSSNLGVDPLTVFNEEFAYPQMLPGYEGTCYSWDWGNSHFASIDTSRYNNSMNNSGMHYISDEEIKWLDEDLAGASSRHVRHIFVFGHGTAFDVPGYSRADSVFAYPEQRDKFWAVLAKYKADAYICGHQHTFDDSITQNGVVQWCNGNSGVVREDGKNYWTLWTVRGDKVTAEVFNEYGIRKYNRIFQSSQP